MLVTNYKYLEVTAEAPGATAIRARARFLPDDVQAQTSQAVKEVKGLLNLLFATLSVVVLAILSAAPLAYLCVGLVGGIFVSEGIKLFFRKQSLHLARQQWSRQRIEQAQPQQQLNKGGSNGKFITNRKNNAQVPVRL